MKSQITNSALASFFFWADHRLVADNQGYKNVTSKLYYTPDERLNGYVAYSSPYKQWVYDKSTPGAFICNSISGTINLVNNVSGMQIDYDNGRVILPASFGTSLNISGSYAVKELNCYLSNETEEELLTTKKFTLNPRFSLQQATGAIPPYAVVNPAMYFNNLNNNNDPFALGGLEETTVNLSIIAMTETMSQLDSVMAIFGDAARKCFPVLSVTDDPLNEFGNVKTGLYPSGYNYETVMAQKGTPGNLFFIENARASKIADKIKINNETFACIIDIDVSRVRLT